MLEKPGDQVLITNDIREGSKATGSKGVYEGDFPIGVHMVTPDGIESWDFDYFINGRVSVTIDGVTSPAVSLVPQRCMNADEAIVGNYLLPKDDNPSHGYWFFVDTNPRLLLEDGSRIWGMECWWRSLKPDEVIDMDVETENLQKHINALRDMIKAVCEKMEESNEIKN